MVLVRLKPEASTVEFVDSAAHGRSTRSLRTTGSAVLFIAAKQAENGVRLSATFERG